MRRTLIGLIVAVTLLVGGLGAQQRRPQEVELQAAIRTETVDRDLTRAIAQYRAIVTKYSADRPVVAQALVRMAECYQALGDAQARAIYARVLNEFGDQNEAASKARTRLATLQPPVSQTKQVAREIWTGAGVRYGRPSSDGRYLSFPDLETGDLAIRDLITGTNRRVNNTTGWVEYASDSVMSPDGRQVAYAWYTKGSQVELRVSSIAAGEAVRTTVVRPPQNDYVGPMAWMPDGKQLMVIRGLPDRTNQIGTFTIQDGTFRSIKSLEWRYPDLLSLSPDGRYIAYDVPAGENGSPRDIFVLATDGSRETAVVRNPANDSSPLWSPDGSRLVFLSDRLGSRGIWTVPIEDGRPNGEASSIKTDIGQITLMGLTKTGMLYYHSVTGAPNNLHMADLDAMRATRLPVPATERVIDSNVGSAWSRDGAYLAYYSFREPAVRLLVIRSTTTGEERTVPLPARVESPWQAGPKWFPDNRSVLILSRDAQGDGFGFYRLALDTGNTELLTHLRGTGAYDLSPDGRSIFYISGVGDTRLLMRFDVESRRETELRKGINVVSLAVSPDGLQLATMLIGGVLEVMPTAGGQSRGLFRSEPPEILTGSLRNALAWTPDQRFLLFALGDFTLWKVPALGGEALKVGISMPGLKSPSVHPDGKRIVFSGVAEPRKMAVWALENFLPASPAKK